MASGDIYELIDRQTFQGQLVENVYFYEQRAAFVPVSESIAYRLAEEWTASIMPSVRATQAASLMHTSVFCRNLFDDTDTGEFVAMDAGTGSGGTQDMPSFNAWGLSLQHDNSSIRPGGKRIAGLEESMQEDGVPLPAFVTTLNTLGDKLAAPITGGLIISDDIMFPVVVQRIREGTEGAYTYRLPETSGEAVVGTIIETLVKLFITSQVSRKFGVGA